MSKPKKKSKPAAPGPNVSWRDGRPRFNPARRLRAAGYKGQDLKHPDGSWFTWEQARAWAIENAGVMNGEIAARPADERRAIVKAEPTGGHTVAELLADWMASPAFKLGLRESSQRDYEGHLRYVLFKRYTRDQWRRKEPRRPEGFPQLSVRVMDVPKIMTFLNYQIRERSIHMARKTKAMLQAAWRFGHQDEAWAKVLPPIPWIACELPLPEPVPMVYEDFELRALIAAANAMGRASIGHSVVLGYFTGQRQSDRLDMTTANVNGRPIVQDKTRAIVELDLPELTGMLEEAARHTSETMLRLGIPAEKRPPQIVVDETTGRRYNRFTYTHVFAKVRALAIKGSKEHGLAPCPSLAGKKDKHMRHTCITTLSWAGCSPDQIAGITGHKPATIMLVLKSYRAISTKHAKDAIAMRRAYMAREGLRVI